MPQTGCQPRAFRVENTLDPTRSSELEYKGWKPNTGEDPVCEGKIVTWRVNREGCTASRCSDVPSLITAGEFSCPSGQVYNAANAGTACLGLVCDSEKTEDKAACCTAPAKCSTVASTSGFCGSGMVINVAAATTDCAVAPCQGDTTSTKADVARCCKAA